MPSLSYWFATSALFNVGSFVLFAILGFAGVASMTARYRGFMIAGYVVAFVLFILCWWQAARQEEAADIDRDVIKKIAAVLGADEKQSSTSLAVKIALRPRACSLCRARE
jgi:hypothetical protein